MRTFTTIIIAAAMCLLPRCAVADSELKETPTFDQLLAAQPIVVLARMTQQVRTSSKTFKALDAERSPAYTEEYNHYGFQLREALKGSVPESFEIRQIAGDNAPAQVTFRAEQEVLLILGPDVGKDAEGQPRRGYLVSFAAHYPIVDDAITVTAGAGTETWTLEKVRGRLAELQTSREQRAASNPETLEAATAPVVSGELEAGPDEPALPEAAVDRPPGLTPPGQLADTTPNNIGSPAEDDTPDDETPDDDDTPDDDERPPDDDAGITWWVWVVVAIVVLILLIAFQMKSRF